MVSDLFRGLKWLGLPDFRNVNDQVASALVRGILDRCTGLSALSVRHRQSSDDITDPHDYVCRLPSMIAAFGPSALTHLELRLPFMCLDGLMINLDIRGSTIRHIGIDLGAWIQLHPKGKKTTEELKEIDVKKTARLAAKKERFDIYEGVHNARLQAEEKWRLPRSHIKDEGSAYTELYSRNAKHAFEQNFYDPDRESIPPHVPVFTNAHDASDCEHFDHGHADDLKLSLSDADPSTLPEMLNNMYRAAGNNPDFKLFPLEPEWQGNSNDPLHPFALIQRPTSSSLVSKTSSTPGESQNVYKWLNRTFNWRPVFDWDSLVRCKAMGHDQAYKQLWERYGLDSPHSICHDANAEIADHFQSLKFAGIPIHIFFGRRCLDSPSLYWGWPYNKHDWSKWLIASFGANIGLVASLVDTLSIMYDLRDPIDASSPLNVSASSFPRPTCPWARDRLPCPFATQWCSTPISPRGQKMANKHLLRPPSVLKPLAPHFRTLPSSGQYASETPALADPHVAAAFKREALGWHRFWSTYAPRFTNLTQLNVRMPASFDTVGSIRLARLLDPAKGWRHVHYAAESGDADLGGFVRRTWVCQDLGTSIGEVGDIEAEREKELFEKGVKMVDEADKECEGVEAGQATKDGNSIKSNLRDGYGRRIRRVAEEAWRTRMRGYTAELAEQDNEGQTQQVRRVLQRTLSTLGSRIPKFSALDVFTHDPKFRNNIGLVSHTIDYAAEEDARRARPAAYEPQPIQTGDSWDLCSSGPSHSAPNSAYNLPPAHDYTNRDAEVYNQHAALRPADPPGLQNMADDSLGQVSSAVSTPTDLASILAALQYQNPVNFEPPDTSNAQDGDGLVIPTDLERILATLQQAGIMNALPPVATEAPESNNPTVDQLLEHLQRYGTQAGGPSHEQMLGIHQDDPARWSVGAVVGDGEDAVDAQVEATLQEYQVPETLVYEEGRTIVEHLVEDDVDVEDFYGAGEELAQVETSAQRIVAVDNVTVEVASTTVHREEERYVKTSKRPENVVASLEQHAVGQDSPAQQKVPVKKLAIREDPITPNVLSQLKELAPAYSLPHEGKPTPTRDPSSNAPKKPITAEQSEPIKAIKSTKTKTYKVAPTPAESSKSAQTQETPTIPHPQDPSNPSPTLPTSALKSTIIAPSSHSPKGPAQRSLPPRSPSLAPPARKPPTKLKRKDPVIPDEPIDLSAGRTLRSKTRSRSGTPVMAPSYKDDSDDEAGGVGKGFDDGKVGWKAGVKRGKKIGVDEEWDAREGERKKRKKRRRGRDW